MNNIINLLEEKKNLNIGDYGDRLLDFKCSNVDSAFVEIANNGCDIYFSQRLVWLKENEHSVEFIERVINEGLTDTLNFNFYGCLADAQYLQIIDDLNANEEDIKLNYALNYLINNKGIEELDEDVYAELVSNITMCDTTNGIIDEINEILEVEEYENN